MLTKVQIQRFRSLYEVEVELAPLVVLYGGVGAGKSNLGYALLVLKNFLLDSNRSVENLLQLGFMGLGRWEDCVWGKIKDSSIQVSLTYHYPPSSDKPFRPQSCQYGITFTENEVHFAWESSGIVLKGKGALPYAPTYAFSSQVELGGRIFNITWNGITGSASVLRETGRKAEPPPEPHEVADWLNQPVAYLRQLQLLPPIRGFTKPFYTPVSQGPLLCKEEEVATLLLNDLDLPLEVSIYLERITGRQFQTLVQVGTSTGYLRVVDKEAHLAIPLVGEGFGVNQTAYLLTLLLYKGTRILVVEEPEIHLHPKVQRALAITLLEILRDPRHTPKQVILTTHSEVLVSALLSEIAEGRFPAEAVRFYWVKKDKENKSQFHSQTIHPNGQIEGGLVSFMEAELENLLAFLGKTHEP